MPIAGPGTRVSYTPAGAVITAATSSAVASAVFLPFTVRFHHPSNSDGQWEIFLPNGCVVANYTCTPINSKASETSGHDGDGDDWYVLPFSASPSSGEIYDVVVHAKQRVVDVEDVPQSGDPEVAPASLAWMHKRVEPSEQTDSEKNAYAGDTASVTVASIKWQEQEDGSVSPVVNQSGVHELSVPGTPDQEFDLWWGFTIEDTTITVPKMGLLRRTLSTGTDVATITDSVDVSGASKGIYLRVVLNQSGATEITVAVDVSQTAAGINFFIVQLYSVDQWHRASDYRSALWRLPMYLGGI